MNRYKNVVIHLLGLAGTGKLTIARALCNSIDAALIDAHLINNPVFRAVKADGVTRLPDIVWPLTHKIRMTVLEAITLCGPRDANYIFTNAPLTGDAQDAQQMADMRKAFERIGKTYIPVRLTCAEEELVKRRTSPGRKENLKDISADNARRESRECEILHTGHGNEMTLDVTLLSPDDAAAAILKHIDGILKS